MRRKEREARCKEELLLKEDAMQDNEQVEQEALHMGEEVQWKRKKMEIGNQAEWEGAIKTACSCYVTVGTFARRGLSSTAKTLRSLSGVRGSEY